MRLVFLGPPGAGKGTQAERLSGELGLAHVSTGDILRKEVREGSPIGKKAQSFMEKGALVPDEIVIEMVDARIHQPDAKRGFILDGFPRNRTQAVALDKKLGDASPIDRALYFELSDAAVMARLSGRFTCRSCGSIFNVRAVPPRTAGRCDNCNGELYQREDDKPATIERRLEVYRRETAALIDYYSSRNCLTQIAADQPPAEVSRALLLALEALR